MSTVDGNVRLFCGDCFEVLPTLPSSSVNMVLADLPYGFLNKGNKDAVWDTPIDLSLLWNELLRVGTPACAFVFFSSGMFTHDLIESNRRMFKYTLVWDKKMTTGFLNAKKAAITKT